ncbi:hypothetical protein [Methanosarcina siciliae]|nr:hypothetical protein [Methanosarcina siciliae]
MPWKLITFIIIKKSTEHTDLEEERAVYTGIKTTGVMLPLTDR